MSLSASRQLPVILFGRVRAGQGGRVIVEQFGETGVALGRVGAPQIVFEVAQLALRQFQIARVQFSPVQLAPKAHACEVLTERIVTIQTVFALDSCPEIVSYNCV